MLQFINGSDESFAALAQRASGHVFGFVDQLLPPGAGMATARVAFEIEMGGRSHLMVYPVPGYTRPESDNLEGINQATETRLRDWLCEGRTSFTNFNELRDWIRGDLALVFGVAGANEGENAPTSTVHDIRRARRIEVVAVFQNGVVRNVETPSMARALERQAELIALEGVVSLTLRALAEGQETVPAPAWEGLAQARAVQAAAEAEAERLRQEALQAARDRAAARAARAAARLALQAGRETARRESEIRQERARVEAAARVARVLEMGDDNQEEAEAVRLEGERAAAELHLTAVLEDLRRADRDVVGVRRAANEADADRLHLSETLNGLRAEAVVARENEDLVLESALLDEIAVREIEAAELALDLSAAEAELTAATAEARELRQAYSVAREASTAANLAAQTARAAAAAAERRAAARARRAAQSRYILTVTNPDGTVVTTVEVSGRGRANSKKAELEAAHPNAAVSLRLATQVVGPDNLPTTGYLVTVRYADGRVREIDADTQQSVNRRRGYYGRQPGVSEVSVLNYATAARRRAIEQAVGGQAPPDSWFYGEDQRVVKVVYQDGTTRDIVCSTAALASRREAYYRRQDGVASATTVVVSIVARAAAEVDAAPVAVPGQGAVPEPLCYRTEDGLATFAFRFAANPYAGDLSNQRITVYIASQPPYEGRREDDMASHRLGGRPGWGIHRICWNGDIRNEAAARGLAATWSNLTWNYIRTGRRFGPQ